MGGTKVGGKKAAITNKTKHGINFYAEIGRKGGRNGHTGGFVAETVGKDGLTGSERARIAGKKGGKLSRRGKSPRDENGNVIHTSAYTIGRECATARKTKQDEEKKGGWRWPFWGRKSE